MMSILVATVGAAVLLLLGSCVSEQPPPADEVVKVPEPENALDVALQTVAT